MNTTRFDWSGKKVLVTGASGFKGSWLASALIELGARVYGVTRRRVHPHSAFKVLSVADRVVSVDADISDRQQVYDLLNTVEPDVIFHLGAIATVPVALRDPRRTYEVNTFGTLNLLEGCRRLNIGTALVVCSTDHVFGTDHPLPPGGFDEQSDVHFAGPYDTSKAAMELIVRSYDRTYATPQQGPLTSLRAGIGITRCANVFGKGDVAFRRVIPNFVRCATLEGSVPLSHTENGRQFIYVTDAIEGYIRFAAHVASLNPRQDCKIAHFAITQYEGTADPFVRLKDLANQVAAVTGATVRRDPLAAPFAANENQVQALNCERTYETLAWRPRTSMQSGLARLPDWFRAVDRRDARELERLAAIDLRELLESLS